MSEPVVTLAKAAELCGVSIDTVRRKRATLATLGATPSPRGWKIPISALIASGLLPNVTPPLEAADATRAPALATPAATPAATPSDDVVAALNDKVAALESALVAERQKLAIAEAVMAEKERVIITQERALALLEAAPSPGNEFRVAEAPRQRRWWKRS